MPPNNRKYDQLKSQNVNILPYTHKEDIEPHLHRAGYFNIVVCDKNQYHGLKEFPKLSPRCILMVEDATDLQEDELLFHRYPQYAIYYGPNGAEYLRKVLPRTFNPSR